MKKSTGLVQIKLLQKLNELSTNAEVNLKQFRERCRTVSASSQSTYEQHVMRHLEALWSSIEEAEEADRYEEMYTCLLQYSRLVEEEALMGNLLLENDSEFATKLTQVTRNLKTAENKLKVNVKHLRREIQTNLEKEREVRLGKLSTSAQYVAARASNLKNRFLKGTSTHLNLSHFSQTECSSESDSCGQKRSTHSSFGSHTALKRVTYTLKATPKNADVQQWMLDIIDEASSVPLKHREVAEKLNKSLATRSPDTTVLIVAYKEAESLWNLSRE